MPAPGVEPRELAPRQRIGASGAVRRAVERRVVQQERDAVGGELHVDLGHPVAVRVAEPQRRERVLRRELARRRDARSASDKASRSRRGHAPRQTRAASPRRTGRRATGRRQRASWRRASATSPCGRRTTAVSAPCARCTSVSAPSCSTISIVPGEHRVGRVGGGQVLGPDADDDVAPGLDLPVARSATMPPCSSATLPAARALARRGSSSTASR